MRCSDELVLVLYIRSQYMSMKDLTIVMQFSIRAIIEYYYVCVCVCVCVCVWEYLNVPKLDAPDPMVSATSARVAALVTIATARLVLCLHIWISLVLKFENLPNSVVAPCLLGVLPARCSQLSFWRVPSAHQVEPLDQIRLGCHPTRGLHRSIRSSRWTKFDSVVILLASYSAPSVHQVEPLEPVGPNSTRFSSYSRASIGPSYRAIGPNSTRFSSYSRAPSVHQVEPLDQIRLGSHPTRRLHRSIIPSHWTKFDSVCSRSSFCLVLTVI